MNDRMTLLLLAVAVALVAVIFVFTPQVSVKPPGPPEPPFPTTAEEVTKVELVGANNELVLVKATSGDWFMKQSPHKAPEPSALPGGAAAPAPQVEPVADKADTPKVGQLIGGILALRESAAPVRPKHAGERIDLGHYGLVEAERRIILSYGRGIRRILNLGVVTPGEDGIYARFEDGNDVITLPLAADRLLSEATDDPSAYRNRRLFELARLDDVSGIDLKTAGDVLDLQARHSGDLWLLRMGKEQPPPAPQPLADRASKEALDRLVERFKAMRIEKFVYDNLYVEATGPLGLPMLQPNEQKLALMGLTEDSAAFLVGFAGKDAPMYTLLIGNPTPADPSLRFVRWLEPPYEITGQQAGADFFQVMPEFHVYAVKADVVKDLPDKLADYRDRKLMPLETTRVARIEIGYDPEAVQPARTATMPATVPATLPAAPFPDRPKRIVLVREVGENDRLLDKWRIETPVATEADNGTVEDLLRGLRAASALEFADNQGDQELGLAPAAERISLYDKDAKLPKATLLLSRPVGTRFFARMSADNIARQFDATDLERLDLPLMDLYQRQMVPTSLAKATSLTLERTGEPTLVAEHRASGEWFITAPFRCAGGSNLQSLVDAMGNLKAVKAVADGPADLAAYGLDKPVIVLSAVEPREKKLIVTTQPETVQPTTLPEEYTYTVRVGGPVPDSTDRYAMVEGGGIVYRIRAALADDAAKELRGDRVVADMSGLEIKDIDSLQLTKNNLTLQLRQSDGTWKATSPKAFDAEKDAADEAAQKLLDLKGGEFTVVSDKAALGLDAPQLQAKVDFHRPGEPPAEPQTVLVGKEFSVKKDEKETKYYYVQTQGESVARHVAAADLAELMRGYEAYMPKEMVKIEEKHEATAITLKRPGLTFSAVKEGYSNWKLTEPVADEANWNVSTMVGELSTLKADKVVADEPADLGKYGLADPAYVATLTIEPTEKPASVPASAPAPPTLTISLGSPVDPAKPDGPRYAMVSDKNRVYEVPGSLTEKLDAKIRKDDLFGTWPTPESVTIARGGEQLAIVKTSADGVDKYFITAAGTTEAAKKDDCKTLFDAFREFKSDKYVLQKTDESRLAGFGLDKPAIHVEMKEKDKQPVVLEIGKLTPETAAKSVTDQRYYARLPAGEGVFTMKAEDVLKLAKPAADYIEPPASQPASAPATAPATAPAGP